MLVYLHANASCSAQNLVLFTVVVSAIGIELPMIYLIERFTRRKSLSWFALIGITLLLTYVSIYFVGAYIFILYATDSFSPAGVNSVIPGNGDTFGLVVQLCHKARLENSGINSMQVGCRSIQISFSAACTPQSIVDLFMAALRTCGVPYEIVGDITP